MESLNIDNLILDAASASTKTLIHHLLDKSMCPVCQEHMCVPFMTKCGHNFCYECILSWFSNNESKPTCPACRAAVSDAPYFNPTMQSLVDSLLHTAFNGDLTKMPEDMRRDRELKLRKYKHDMDHNRLFGNLFEYQKRRQVIIDNEDGVSRCSNCHWEVRGNRCPNCHLELQNPYALESESEDAFTDYSDSDIEHGFIVDRRASDDDFLDDRAVEQLEIHEDIEDMLSSVRSSPVRGGARRRYFPSNLDNAAWAGMPDRFPSTDSDEPYEDWDGFHEDEVNRVLNQPAELDVGSEDEDEEISIARPNRNSYRITNSSDEEDF